MANLMILVGIPGSGKSTWARKTLPRGHQIVSSDDIRKNLFSSLQKAHDGDSDLRRMNNELVFEAFYAQIGEILGDGVSAVADSTALTVKARDRLYDIARDYGADVHVVAFINVTDAVLRNAKRIEGARVPEGQMLRMLGQLRETMRIIDREPYTTLTKVESFA